MAHFKRIFTAACLAVVASFGATAAERLTGSQIKGFMSSFPELKTFAEQRRIDFEKDRNRQYGSERRNFSPFSQGVGQLRAAGAYGGANRIVRRHGFSNMESWAGIADRILRAYIGVNMQEQQPRMAAGIGQARQMIMNNPHMTPEQKAQALASIGASMQNFQQMQSGSAADKAAILPYRTQLDTVFENDRANRGMRRKGYGTQPGPAMPAQGQAVSEGAAGGAAIRGNRNPGGVKARLSKLKELFDAGLINQQEYDAKRSQILREL